MGSAPAQTQPEPAAPVDGCLLVQAAAKESLDVVRLADRPGSGLVFTGAGAVEVVHAARRHGYRQPILTDRRRYAGAARIRGTAQFAPAWLTGQRDAGVTPVLTDSGYIGEGDLEALRAVLGQAADAGPDVTAVLPMHAHWLRQDRKTLIEEVGAHGVPVAVVFEHRSDPLATPGGVAGLIDLLRQAPSVALLATGVGALAALAFGARWAAVGVRSSLRHLRPVTSEEEATPKRARWRPAAPEIVATPVLSFASVAEVLRAAEAVRAADGDAGWACPCSTCHGRTPQWLASASGLEANAHTFDVLLGHACRLLRRSPGPARERAWREVCRAALDRYHKLGLPGLGWEPPRFVTAWAGPGGHRDASSRPGRVASAAPEPGLRSAG